MKPVYVIAFKQNTILIPKTMTFDDDDFDEDTLLQSLRGYFWKQNTILPEA